MRGAAPQERMGQMEKTTNILLTDDQIKEMIFACRERSNECYTEFIGCLRYCTNEEMVHTARYFRNEIAKYEELISLLNNSESINP